MNLGDWEHIARLAQGKLLRPGRREATGVAVDSRRVQPGDLFVALPGARVDGHSFLAEAAARGASGALVSRPQAAVPADWGLIFVDDALAGLQRWATAHRRALPGRVIGVTGSNGKTTTKDMTAHVLRSLGRAVCATRGNLNSQIGLPLMLLSMDASHTHAVMEMGASARGDLARLAQLACPSVAVVTGIGRAHLETFGSLEGVLAAKWELVNGLNPHGVAFLNADDPLLMERKKSHSGSVVTFGMSPSADVRAENIHAGPTVEFDLAVGSARARVQLAMPGLFNVSNALAAAAVAMWERAPLPAIAAALATFSPSPQRMEVRRGPGGSVWVVDSYNANPDSMVASVDGFVRAYPSHRRLVVLGSMLELGTASELEHRRLGQRLAGWALEGIFFVGDEGPWVREGYLSAGGTKTFTMGLDKAAVRRELEGWMRPETAVLFKASRGVALEDVYTPLLEG